MTRFTSVLPVIALSLLSMLSRTLAVSMSEGAVLCEGGDIHSVREESPFVVMPCQRYGHGCSQVQCADITAFTNWTNFVTEFHCAVVCDEVSQFGLCWWDQQYHFHSVLCPKSENLIYTLVWGNNGPVRRHQLRGGLSATNEYPVYFGDSDVEVVIVEGEEYYAAVTVEGEKYYLVKPLEVLGEA
uniref:Uncharacterized protein n=1 Tax=Amphora coffeiformis TaxID=265554 RepID=A0A7S3LC63_9STRA|mmetsp:Transcript_12443/g.23746  ORF Transcript_12443/g.23746 Transcript_12443/m.23746 type:complete len:185 (+) Transcript_12443:107-661(+)|eukprot:scaffold9441_cov167-Amphora_coffeaeformis.AAC.3